jgi:hypothetical protein
LFSYKEIQPQASQKDKLGSRGWQKKLWVFAIKAILSDVRKRLLHLSANYIVWRRYMCTEVFFHYCILMWVTVYVFHCKTYWKQHFQSVWCQTCCAIEKTQSDVDQVWECFAAGSIVRDTWHYTKRSWKICSMDRSGMIITWFWTLNLKSQMCVTCEVLSELIMT